MSNVPSADKIAEMDLDFATAGGSLPPIVTVPYAIQPLGGFADDRVAEGTSQLIDQ